MVGLVAAAGGGKSRLRYALRQRLAGARVIYLTGRCLSYGSTIPYYPLIDFVRHKCEPKPNGKHALFGELPAHSALRIGRVVDVDVVVVRVRHNVFYDSGIGSLAALGRATLGRI